MRAGDHALRYSSLKRGLVLPRSETDQAECSSEANEIKTSLAETGRAALSNVILVSTSA